MGKDLRKSPVRTKVREGERAEAVSPTAVEKNYPRCSPWRAHSTADEYLLKETGDHGEPMQE